MYECYGVEWGYGMYVSSDPFNSSQYGNTAFVFVLDRDIKVARFFGHERTRKCPQFAYYNLVDPEIIRKETIPSTGNFVKFLSATQLTLEELDALVKSTTSLNSDYQN